MWPEYNEAVGDAFHIALQNKTRLQVLNYAKQLAIYDTYNWSDIDRGESIPTRVTPPESSISIPYEQLPIGVEPSYRDINFPDIHPGLRKKRKVERRERENIFRGMTSADIGIYDVATSIAKEIAEIYNAPLTSAADAQDRMGVTLVASVADSIGCSIIDSISREVRRSLRTQQSIKRRALSSIIKLPTSMFFNEFEKQQTSRGLELHDKVKEKAYKLINAIKEKAIDLLEESTKTALSTI